MAVAAETGALAGQFQPKRLPHAATPQPVKAQHNKPRPANTVGGSNLLPRPLACGGAQVLAAGGKAKLSGAAGFVPREARSGAARGTNALKIEGAERIERIERMGLIERAKACCRCFSYGRCGRA
jgi:hypothetical protein